MSKTYSNLLFIIHLLFERALFGRTLKILQCRKKSLTRALLPDTSLVKLQ